MNIDNISFKTTRNQKMSQARRWCFTLNNWTEEEYQKIIALPCRYMVIGKEKGEEKNTPHLQGYIEFTSCKRLNTLKKINERIHWEKCKGTQKQNKDYCSKEGDFVEIGEASKQGKRTDLEDIKKIAKTKGIEAVIDAGANYQQINYAEKILKYKEEPRNWKPLVIWIYGKTGTGKSTLAKNILAKEKTYTKSDGSKWWEGYDAHEDVILDDFRDWWWPMQTTLMLLHEHSCRVENKGGSRQFKPYRIVITTIKHPSEHYSNSGEDINQLLRRIDIIFEASSTFDAYDTMRQKLNSEIEAIVNKNKASPERADSASEVPGNTKPVLQNEKIIEDNIDTNIDSNIQQIMNEINSIPTEES